jgi:voltage-dependent calcium channel L type alpha-1D
LRIFKLAKSWQKFSDLLKTIWNTLQDISTFTVLLTLFVFIYTLLGLELFAFNLKDRGDVKLDFSDTGGLPLRNFNTFSDSFLTVFILLTGDQWNNVMYDYYRGVNPYVAVLFFISFSIIGQYILLNLFLAILLQNFDEASIDYEFKKLA